MRNTGSSYTYKPSGRLLTRVWARTPAITTTYGYSAGGDLTSVDYSDSTHDVTTTMEINRINKDTRIDEKINVTSFSKPSHCRLYG